jgi:hypothetical protein
LAGLQTIATAFVPNAGYARRVRNGLLGAAVSGVGLSALDARLNDFNGEFLRTPPGAMAAFFATWLGPVFGMGNAFLGGNEEAER